MENKEILEMNRVEFDDLSKNVIKKAVYKKKGRPGVVDYAKPNDRLTCTICGKDFNRSGRTCHEKTKYHQQRIKINKKLIELLL